MKRALVLALTAWLVVCGCGRKRRAGALAPPLAPVVGSIEVGVASWYGYPYHGRASASGEIYDQEQLTAAHRTLPFGTWVRVTNLNNQRTVELRINDRGPFVDGRIIDVSHAAARVLGLIGPGTGPVRVEVIREPAPAVPSWFAVQVGAFADPANAERLRGEMAAKYGTARLVRRDGTPPLWRVLVGLEASEQQAAALAERIRQQGGESSAFVVRVDSV